jgi:hypothetical protein
MQLLFIVAALPIGPSLRESASRPYLMRIFRHLLAKAYDIFAQMNVRRVNGMWNILVHIFSFPLLVICTELFIHTLPYRMGKTVRSHATSMIFVDFIVA